MKSTAHEFVIECHKGQKRKYTDEPYIVHPEAVARLVSFTDIGDVDDAIDAAYLHDVVEDCGVSLATIEEDFGKQVALYVDLLSDMQTPADGNRAFRKAVTLKRLSTAGYVVQTIKYADIIDNCASIFERDPDFAVVYRKECLELIEAMKNGNPLLRRIAITELTK